MQSNFLAKYVVAKVAPVQIEKAMTLQEIIRTRPPVKELRIFMENQIHKLNANQEQEFITA